MARMPSQTLRHLVPNLDGWVLSLNQTWDPARLDHARRPVLIVPGYGMNSFIYGYHPTGLSLEGFLVEAGLEVWRADLRAQGGSKCDGGSLDFGMEDLALADLGAVVDAVRARTKTRAAKVDALGGSLGGTLVMAHAVLRPDHGLGTLVVMGSPLTWIDVHPLVRFTFASPWLAGKLPLRGTRKLAEVALPLAAKYAPRLLSVYMNPELTDTRAAPQMVQTVEDPVRTMNRQIAEWIAARELTLQGVNVSQGFARVENPLLCLLARGDGIVRPATAAFPYQQSGACAKRLVEVGTSGPSVAHADLFVSRIAQEQVFTPIRDWFLEQQ